MLRLKKELPRLPSMPQIGPIGPVTVRTDVRLEFPPKRLHVGYEVDTTPYYSLVMIEVGPILSAINIRTRGSQDRLSKIIITDFPFLNRL